MRKAIVLAIVTVLAFVFATLIWMGEPDTDQQVRHADQLFGPNL